jgi:hypothetical protein
MPEPEVRIKIKSTADNSGSDSSRKSFGDFAREIPGVGRALELLKNPAAQVAALLTALAAGARTAITEFAQAETQMARLDAALARNGLLTDSYRKKLHDLAGEMQTATGVADDQWLEALRKLTQFGGNPGNIDALAKAVENLAGVMDGDLAGAAELVGRALQGNYEAFGRYGIALETTGDKAEDLEALLKKLAELGEGQLAAANETMAGGFRKLRNGVSDAFESVGGLIARTQIVQSVTYGFATSLDWLAKKIGPTPQMLDGLTNKTREAGESLAEARDGAREFADNLGDIRTEAEAIAAALNAALTAKKALFDEHNERDDSLQEMSLAMIDRDVAAGKISEPDARVQRAGVKQFYAGRRHERQQELLRSEIAMVDEQDQAAAGEIGEITGRIGEAQATSRNAAQLEAKRRRAQELKQEMLVAMRDEERFAGIPFGWAAVSPELSEARTEGKRKRYFEAATELSVIAAGMPRDIPFTTTAQAREEAVTAAGVPRIAELTGQRTDLAARRESLQAQMETGSIRYGLGLQTEATKLQAAQYQDIAKQKEEAARQKELAAGRVLHGEGGADGGGAGVAQAVNDLERMTRAVEHIPQVLLEAIKAAADKAERVERQLEDNHRINRDQK